MEDKTIGLVFPAAKKPKEPPKATPEKKPKEPPKATPEKKPKEPPKDKE